MNIAILAEFAVASGGAEKVAVESARGLAEAGHAVTYIQAIDGPTDALLDHPGITRVTLYNADIWDRPAYRAALSGMWDRPSAARLGAALDALPVRPDLVHIHQWTRSLSPSVFPTLFARDLPVVVTLHDYFMACPNGVYYRFDTQAPCALTPLSPGCLAAPCDGRSRLHKLVRVGRNAVLRTALRRQSLDVIHVCDASVARMGGLLGHLDLTHHRVDNPVRVARATPADPAQGDAVVYIGRLTREKGADLVAAAAERAGLAALFIGTGPLKTELAAQPHVEILGWRSPDAVWETVRGRARALVAPSRWYETGPLTVYEALAHGIPVIASIRAGAAERIVDGVTGFTVEPEIAALTVAMRRLSDAKTRRTLGTAASERYWAAPTTLATHAAALESTYACILRERANRGRTEGGRADERRSA